MSRFLTILTSFGIYILIKMETSTSLTKLNEMNLRLIQNILFEQSMYWHHIINIQARNSFEISLDNEDKLTNMFSKKSRKNMSRRFLL